MTGYNQLLDHLDSDFLYHFGIGTADDLKNNFGDVRFIVMGGSASRMELFAQMLMVELDLPLAKPVNLAAKGGRYSLYKVGPVLSVNHNIGASTLSVVLHEMFKLCYWAGAENVHFIRIGTSGGIGVPPGTVVIADAAVDALKRNKFHYAACGVEKTYDMVLDKQLAQEIKDVATSINIPADVGTTMGTDDFYLGQGRIDGFLCNYSEIDKMRFLNDIFDHHNVKNIEMEAHILSAYTHAAGFKDPPP